MNRLDRQVVGRVQGKGLTLGQYSSQFSPDSTGFINTRSASNLAPLAIGRVLA